MSSTYRFMCLSHDPATFVEPWETQSRNEAVGLAERHAEASQLAGHRDCRLAIGRFSYPLVEAYCLETKRWADADLLRLIVERPGYGFSSASVAGFDSWKAAVGSLRSAPASAGASAERGNYTLALPYGRTARGTIRLEDT